LEFVHPPFLTQKSSTQLCAIKSLLMTQVILYSIPLEELKALIREVVREEIRNAAPNTIVREYVTIKEACIILRICRGTIYNLSKQGLLVKHVIGGRRLFKYLEIEAAAGKFKKYERRIPSWKQT
jgi:hypothetical protein